MGGTMQNQAVTVASDSSTIVFSPAEVFSLCLERLPISTAQLLVSMDVNHTGIVLKCRSDSGGRGSVEGSAPLRSLDDPR